jgi:hypothetical protein
VGLWAGKSAVLVSAKLGLSDKAARCLGHMALTALDKEDEARGVAPRRFFGGRNSLAIGIGFGGEDANSQAARSAVKRALRQLIDSEVVQVWRDGVAGKQSEYYLRIRSDIASDEVLPPLPDAPAAIKRTAQRSPNPKKAHGLRTRGQRAAADPPGPPSGTHGDRPAVQEGTAQRPGGDRPAPIPGPPSGPPNRSNQKDQDEQHVNRTRALAHEGRQS